jgi:nitrogen fixation protein FixH
MTAISSGHEPPPNQAEIDKRRGRFVPWVIAAFYLTFMSALIIFVVIAYQHPPNEVTPEAYEKGLAYNSAIAGADRQTQLGWNSTVDFNGQTLTFRLQDHSGHPVDAEVKAWFVHPSEVALDQTVELALVGPGLYRGQVKLPKSDNWTVHVTAANGADEYQTVADIAAP